MVYGFLSAHSAQTRQPRLCHAKAVAVCRKTPSARAETKNTRCLLLMESSACHTKFEYSLSVFHNRINPPPERSRPYTPQSGHTQSSGISSNAVPGAMPLSGSPTSGSYTYPHVSHTYFFIIFFSVNLLLRQRRHSLATPALAKIDIYRTHPHQALSFLYILTTREVFCDIIAPLSSNTRVF